MPTIYIVFSIYQFVYENGNVYCGTTNYSVWGHNVNLYQLVKLYAVMNAGQDINQFLPNA